MIRIGHIEKLILAVPLCWILQIFTPVIGQQNESGHYPLYNFTPKEYSALDQNWCAVQDKRGLMYFGNTLGILEYDGENWTLISKPDGNIIYSMAVDKMGRIFYGSVSEFGYLEPDSIGKLTFRSLSDQIPEEFQGFNEVWNTHVYKDGIIFQSYNYLFYWQDDTIKTIYSEEEINESFLVGGELYISFLDYPPGIFNGSDIVPLFKEDMEFPSRICGMTSISKEKILVATEAGGFYILKTDKNNPGMASLNQQHTRNDSLFYNLDIFGMLAIGPDRIVLGTWGNGTLLIDSSFNVLSVIDKKSGLQDQVVQGQFIDREGNLWLALSSGISRVEVQTALTHFSDNEGLDGSIEAIVRFNGKIYVTTNIGLFSMEQQKYNPGISQFTRAVFRPVKGFEFECWDMIVYKNGKDEVLLLITNDQVLELNKDLEVQEVLKDIYAFKLYQSGINPRRVYIGLESGLLSIYRSNKEWITEDSVPGVQELVKNLSEDRKGNLWAGTGYEGVLKLQMKETGRAINPEYSVERFGEEEGLPEGPFIFSEVKNTPIVATNKGLYTFVESTNRFTPDTSFGSQFADGSRYIHRISEFQKHGIYMVTITESNGLSYEIGYFEEEKEGGYTWVNEPFNGIAEELIHAVFQEENDIVWLGGSSGLYRFNTGVTRDYSREFNAYIRTVKSKDRNLFEGAFSNTNGIQSIHQAENEKMTLPYKDNSFIFLYAAEPSEDESFTQYSYMLEGDDKSWSDWTKESRKEYTRLREGKYNFRVKAKNVFGTISNEASYEFSILAPWYRKFWAYVIYVIIAASVVYVIVKVYTRSLRQIIKERTAEVVAQKEVIEEKNNDIMDSIMYAQKIQRALLPPEDDLSKLNLDGFILFLPRDFVSGDFYWIGNKGNKVITVAADCTGHGVPGAFMSMLGVAFLNNIIGAQGIVKASDILNELRSEVIAALKQKGQEGEQKDGMDLALHVIDYENMKLEFAGANNPLILLRDNEVIQFKADRMPIGIHDRAGEPFQNQEFELKKGDVLYTFSDGFQDQFGGPKNKKFMIKKLKELFLEIYQKPMDEQKHILEKAFFDWIIPYGAEQIDDVIVIGVRI